MVGSNASTALSMKRLNRLHNLGLSRICIGPFWSFVDMAIFVANQRYYNIKVFPMHYSGLKIPTYAGFGFEVALMYVKANEELKHLTEKF